MNEEQIASGSQNLCTEFSSGPIARRGFLSRLAAATGATVAGFTTGMLVGAPTAKAQDESGPSPSDIQTVQAVLNNEYMEAEFYLRAVFGTGLSDADTTGPGASGPVIVEKETKIDFESEAIKAIARSLANDELAHVREARATLTSFGVTPPGRPTIDLRDSWRTLGRLANIGADFNPFANERDFLLAAYYFEENASQVNRGFIETTFFKPLQSAVAGRLGAEAYHGGYVRFALVIANEFDRVNRIAQLRNRLINRPSPTDPGLGTREASILAPVNAGLIFDRTVREQLNILYLAVNANAGGFFPNGANIGAQSLT
jgi:Ferritin-like domain